MVNIVEVDTFTSDANFIIRNVNCCSVDKYEEIEFIDDFNPHIEKEYLRYCKHCKKNKIDILGTVQYIPIDDWALVMCDTMNNRRVDAYDSKYQYVANMFCLYNEDQDVNLDAFRNCLEDVKRKAEAVNGSVSIPYNTNGKITWDYVCKIVKDVFDNSSVSVEICKHKG